MLAGQQRNILAYAEGLCKAPVPAWALAPLMAKGGWLSLAGSPDSLSVMSESNVVLAPQWVSPEKDLADTPEVRAVSLTDAADASRRNGQEYRQKADFKDGRVEATITVSGRAGKRFVVPPVTHPVVVDDLVLTRSQDDIVAQDIITGEVVWRGWSTSSPWTRRFPPTRATACISSATRRSTPAPETPADTPCRSAATWCSPSASSPRPTSR